MLHKQCAVLSLLVLLPSSAGADDATIQKFRTEAPAAWSRLKFGIASAVSFKGTITSGRIDARTGQIASPARMSWSHAVLGTADLFVVTEDSAAGKAQRAEVRNREYAFNLRRDTPERPWTLNHLDYASPPGRKLGFRPFLGITLEEIWLDDLVRSDTFTVNSVEPDGPTCYRVSFASRYKLDQLNTILGGTLWVDASRLWVMTRYELKMQSKDPGTVECVLSYQDLGGFPFPRTETKTYRFPPDIPLQYVTEYSDVSRATQESDYWLSAFGLPEPKVLRPQRKWIWLWVNGAAIALLVASLYLRRRAARPAQAPVNANSGERP